MSHPIKPCPKCDRNDLYITHTTDSLDRNIFRLCCPHCSYKSGALPSTSPEDFKFAFGKYSGKTFKEVAAVDIGYLKWGADNLDPKMRKKISTYLYNMESKKDAAEANRTSDSIWSDS